MEKKYFILKYLYFQHFKTSFGRFHFSLRFPHLTYINLYVCIYIYSSVCTYIWCWLFLFKNKLLISKIPTFSRKLLGSLHWASHSNGTSAPFLKGIWTVKSVTMAERELPKTELCQEAIHSLVVKSSLVTIYHYLSFYWPSKGQEII